MPTANRGDKIARLHKVLKKHFHPVAPPSDRTLLEHLLYACCLENSRYEKADEAFARLQEMYFDWNEIRVTTVTELAEAMGELHDPLAAASRVKRSLQTIFEKQYSFDLETLKKQNLGKAAKELSDLPSLTPFCVDYVTQHALGGHAIPLDQGALQTLAIVGAVTPAEQEKGRVAGLERAIPKNKGAEFAWLLHQLGAEYLASPFGAKIRALLVEIDPEAKDRLPKRVLKKGDDEKPAAKGAESKGAVSKGAESKQSDAKPSESKGAEAKAGDAKAAKRGKGAESAAAIVEKPAAEKGHEKAGKAAEKHAEKHLEKHPEKHAEKPRAGDKGKPAGRAAGEKGAASEKGRPSESKANPKKAPATATKRLTRKKPR